MDTLNSSNKILIAIVVVVLLVGAAAGVIAMSDKEKEQMATRANDGDTAQTSTNETSGSGTNNATSNSGNYKDGTYNATGNYRTPGGQESIEVTVTLADGVIRSATVTQNASGGEAQEYQERFVSGYSSQVVGKKIEEVSLSRVAGSSLTPLGFNNALDTIKNDATT